jgi:uncharacterized protein (DUF1697 family)
MVDLFVVFYRSMNLGHQGSPRREQLEGALAANGATRVSSFQTNGTVVFEAESLSAAKGIVTNAEAKVQADSGYRDAAFVRVVSELAEVVSRDPFRGATDERTYREMITFFDGGRWDLGTPWTNAKDNVDIIEVHPDYALSVIRKRGSTAGSPTLELESRLRVPATTRTMGTVARLVKSFA